MTLRQRVRTLLSKYDLHAKKRFGQNFLVDDGVVHDIIEVVRSNQPPALIEIGPGLGVLTEHLVELDVPVIGIEKDRELIPVLQTELENTSQLSLMEADALDIDFSTIHGNLQPHIVGNIPYNISSPLIVQLIRQRSFLGPVTLMVQREVAERWMSAPNRKSYGSLSVILQAHADILPVRHVAPQCFLPPPKVDSMVVNIRWLTTPRIQTSDFNHLEKVVRAAFSKRRKTLRNALKGHFSTMAVSRAENVMDLGRRAETLSISEFGILARKLVYQQEDGETVPEDGDDLGTGRDGSTSP